MKKLIILGAAALSLVLGLATSASAQTVPVNLSFDNAVLNNPSLHDAVVVSPTTPPITATAQFNTATGQFSIAPVDFHFPTYSFTSPAPGTLQVSLGSAATGQFDPATGQLSMNADVTAVVTVTGVGECTLDTGMQTYSTENSNVYPGVRFPATATGPVTGPGAITGGWSTVTPISGSGCSVISSALQGPGGLWVSKGIAPPKPAAVSLSVKPARKRITPGKAATFAANVKNAGGLSASGVKVCLAVRKRLRVRGTKCRSIGALAAGASKSVKFKVKSSKRAHGSYKLRFAASGTGVTTVKRTSTLKVRKK